MELEAAGRSNNTSSVRTITPKTTKNMIKRKKLIFARSFAREVACLFILSVVHSHEPRGQRPLARVPPSLLSEEHTHYSRSIESYWVNGARIEAPFYRTPRRAAVHTARMPSHTDVTNRTTNWQEYLGCKLAPSFLNIAGNIFQRGCITEIMYVYLRFKENYSRDGSRGCN